MAEETRREARVGPAFRGGRVRSAGKTARSKGGRVWTGGKTRKPARGSTFLLSIALCATLAAGCRDPEHPRVEANAEDRPKQDVVEQPRPPSAEAQWDELLARAETDLDEQKFDDVRATLDEAAGLLGEESLDEQRRSRRDAVERKLTDAVAAKEEQRRAERTERRAELLESAEQAVSAGNLEEATKTLSDVLALAPTDRERAAVAALDDAIEERRAARRRLGSWLKLLGSENPAEVRAARNQLAREPDVALPLIVEMLHGADAVRVRNALDLLAQMRQPNRTLPEFVALLKRPEQRANWPDAVDVIVRSRAPGAGEPLLDLAANSENAEQRRHALNALVEVPDPPADTLTTLLPRLHADGPELLPALRAASRAAVIHDQRDFAARRNFPVDLDDERSRLLASLPERLAAIGPAEDAESPTDVALAARELATVLKIATPRVLEGVKVLVANDAPEDGPASALLDGQWESTDLATMWRYPDDQTGEVLLDLGTERTVTGVRIWNFNQPGGQHRGWKDVDVYVSEGQTALDPTVRGVLPRAPGAENPPNYGVVIPVPFVRGRYVKLVEVANWGSNSYEGLAEIQVLGF